MKIIFSNSLLSIISKILFFYALILMIFPGVDIYPVLFYLMIWGLVINFLAFHSLFGFIALKKIAYLFLVILTVQFKRDSESNLKKL